MLHPYLFASSRVFRSEVVTDSDMVLDSVVVEPFEPIFPDELPVSNQAFDAVTVKQTNEPLHDIDFSMQLEPLRFWQMPEQDGE